MTTSPPPARPSPAPTPFHEWLGKHANGHLDDQLTAAVRDVAAAVLLHEKGGTVALSLTLTPEGGGVVVVAKVTSKIPAPKERGRFYYVTDTGLSLSDPAQPRLFEETPQ